MAKVKSNLKTRRQTYFKEWRKHRNLTLERLAERINVTIGALSQLENGTTNYTQPMLEALADALYCQPADLIMRPPSVDAELKLAPEVALLWDQIPVADRDQALRILRTFTRNGTNG